MKGQFIYKIINTVNGKFYVGSTTNTQERFRIHRSRLRRGRHHSPHLQAAWIKYGEQAFVFHVIETVPAGQSLQAAEDAWLAAHVGQPHCYNTSRFSDAPWRGGPKEKHPSFGRPKTANERAVLSQRLKAFYASDPENHPRLGKTHTPETKAKISASKRANPSTPWLGKTRDAATRAKIGETQRGKAKGEGRRVSEEGLAKIRAAAAQGHYSHWEGRKHTQEARDKMSRAVTAVSPEGVSTTYASILALREALDLKPSTVNRALKSGEALTRGPRKGWRFLPAVT